MDMVREAVVGIQTSSCMILASVHAESGLWYLREVFSQ